MNIIKIGLSEIKETLAEAYDLFICSSSFEERCLSIAINLDKENIKRALIISNDDLKEYIDPNRKKLEGLFGTKGQSVVASTENPLMTADNVGKNLSKAIDDGVASSILLDMTTFTHESLLILIRLLTLYCPSAKVKGVYANASEYSVKDEVNYKWLSRGIKEVRSVLGFPGNIIPSKKTHLILIVGYEHERAAGIIENIEPNSIALGYGRSGSATTDKDKEANELYMHLVREMATSFSNVNTFEIECDDPQGTFEELQNQINMVKDNYNILIAPMNNKISTIGAAWAAINNKDVQICYAQALRYNYSNYSRLGSHCYIFDLSFF